MTQISFNLTRYPESPGFKAQETSQAAAVSVSSRAATLRESALAALRNAELTADEIAAALNESVLAIRPRVSELLRLGAIRDTGQRRPNTSGHNAIVWRAA